jgi:hypothetical protein
MRITFAVVAIAGLCVTPAFLRKYADSGAAKSQ